MKRYKWIDTLKFWACLFVFFDHFYLSFLWTDGRATRVFETNPVSLLVNGNFSIHLFFILSAFVIARSVYSKKSFDDIKKMMFKRYPRLLLPVLILSVVTFAMKKFGLFLNFEVADAQSNIWLTHYFGADMSFRSLIKETFYNMWTSGSDVFNCPFWMLFMLFQGFFFVIIISMITSNKSKLTFVVFILLALAGMLHDDYALGFVIGTLLAYLDEYYGFEKVSNKKVSMIVGGIIFALGLIVPGMIKVLEPVFISLNRQYMYIASRFFYNCIGAGLIVLGVLLCNPLKSALEKMPFSDSLNKLSFSIYLVHWPIICSFSCAMSLGLMKVLKDNLIINLIVFIPTTIFVFVFAWFFNYFVERKVCDRVVNGLCKLYWKE